MTVACGNCLDCRRSRARQWAIRCVHESIMHEDNCFITLTYDDESLPPDEGLRKGHFQKFMKDLRSRIYPRKVRFFHCGEYGSKLGRPHYHALLFGFDFYDREPFFEGETCRLDRSPMLESIWQRGYSTVGEVTFESAQYVAQYVLKKITGEKAEDHYRKLNPVTGELIEVIPEYITMSLKPGIGSEYFEKHWEEMFPEDQVILGGRSRGPAPRYYLKKLQESRPEVALAVKAKRKQGLADRAEDMTPERLEVREAVLEAHQKLRERRLQ